MAGELLKDKQDCVCGCGLFGTPRKKIWQGETQGHVNRCACRRCVGGRQRAKSRKRENRVAKDLGGQREPLSGGLSGIDVRVGEIVWIEETGNKGLVAGIKRWWTGKGTTSKMARITDRGKAMGVPTAFVGSWDGAPQVAVMDYKSFTDLVEMARECRDI